MRALLLKIFPRERRESINDTSIRGKLEAQDENGNWSQTLVLNHTLPVSFFGQDTAAELYLLDYGNGAVLRVVAAP
jgi:hypothetical protein